MNGVYTLTRFFIMNQMLVTANKWHKSSSTKPFLSGIFLHGDELMLSFLFRGSCSVFPTRAYFRYLLVSPTGRHYFLILLFTS